MENLIKALQIFLKYDNKEHPTWCEHDMLGVSISPYDVSDEDIKELERLGFYHKDDHTGCGFYSFKYGSC